MPKEAFLLPRIYSTTRRKEAKILPTVQSIVAIAFGNSIVCESDVISISLLSVRQIVLNEAPGMAAASFSSSVLIDAFARKIVAVGQ